MESSWGSGLPDARLLRRPARGRIAFGDPRRRAGGAERRHRPARVRPVLLGAPREVRPEMVAALGQLRAEGYRLGCITNNMRAEESTPGEGIGMGRYAEAMGHFEHIIESAAAGVRKPDPRIYAMMCDALALPPQACVYLDDLGVNCKPAAMMGMHAIKVTSAAQALADLGAALGTDFFH